MRDNDGAGVFKREVVSYGAKDVHLSSRVEVKEDAA